MFGYFDIGDVASHRDLGVVQSGPVCRHAVQIDAIESLRTESSAHRAAVAHADFAHHRGVVLQECEFFGIQFRILLLHLEKFLGIEIPDESHANDSKTIRAHAGNVIRDIVIHAADNRHDRDQRRGCEDDAEQGEKTPKLTPAQGVERDRSCLPKRRSLGHGILEYDTRLEFVPGNL